MKKNVCQIPLDWDNTPRHPKHTYTPEHKHKETTIFTWFGNCLLHRQRICIMEEILQSLKYPNLSVISPYQITIFSAKIQSYTKKKKSIYIGDNWYIQEMGYG